MTWIRLALPAFSLALVPAGAVSAPIETIEPVECVTFTTLAEGIHAECGYLRVPENRANPESRRINVPFAVVTSHSAHPRPDPVLFMTGGPGGRTIPQHIDGQHPALAVRDVIYLEQRGTALGRPTLQCPEYVEAAYQAALGAFESAKLAEKRIEAARTCAARARAAGVDLAGYRTTEIAADIEDLRQALGVDRLNLYGLSYSGRVMTTYARDYPQGTRSVVLNSPLPVEANYDEHGSAGMRRTLDMVIDGCAVEPACAAAFPGLRGQFEEIVRRATERPETIRVPDPALPQEELNVTVGGHVLANALLNRLYVPYSFELLPSHIDAIHRGDREALASILDVSHSSYAWLMRIAVWCNEEYPFEDRAAVRRQALDYPEFAGVDQSTVPEGVCEAAAFGDVKPDPVENEPVTAPAPTVVFSGEFDPATPPSWGAAMAAKMPNAQHALVPGAGHGAGFFPCPTSMMLAFLDEPETPVDSSCLLKMRGADFSRAAAQVAQ